jgi:hypothetical protein
MKSSWATSSVTMEFQSDILDTVDDINPDDGDSHRNGGLERHIYTSDRPRRLAFSRHESFKSYAE